MSTQQRVVLVAGAIAVAVAAFVIAKPGGDDNGSSSGSKARKARKAGPRVFQIALHGGKPDGGEKRLVVKKGDAVRLTVTADRDDEVHVHGADIEKEVGPGHPGRYAFRAKVEGVFDIETHKPEAKIAELVVEPR
jgi:hypothetical protein